MVVKVMAVTMVMIIEFIVVMTLMMTQIRSTSMVTIMPRHQPVPWYVIVCVTVVGLGGWGLL